MKRRDFLKTAGLTAASLALPGCINAAQKTTGKQQKLPNIVFIMT